MQDLPDMLEWILIGVMSDAKSKRVCAHLQDHEGRTHLLSCDGVAAVRATDVLLHNVVEGLVIWQRDSLDDSAIEALWDLLYADADDREQEGYRSAVQAAAAEIKSGAKTLLRIEPIYGATVTILAESFTLGSPAT